MAPSCAGLLTQMLQGGIWQHGERQVGTYGQLTSTEACTWGERQWPGRLRGGGICTCLLAPQVLQARQQCMQRLAALRAGQALAELKRQRIRQQLQLVQWPQRGLGLHRLRRDWGAAGLGWARLQPAAGPAATAGSDRLIRALAAGAWAQRRAAPTLGLVGAARAPVCVRTRPCRHPPCQWATHRAAERAPSPRAHLALAEQASSGSLGVLAVTIVVIHAP